MLKLLLCSQAVRLKAQASANADLNTITDSAKSTATPTMNLPDASHFHDALLVFDDGRELSINGWLLTALVQASPTLEESLRLALTSSAFGGGAVLKVRLHGDSYEGAKHVLEMLDVLREEPDFLDRVSSSMEDGDVKSMSCHISVACIMPG